MTNALAAPTWLLKGAFQWILVCGQGFSLLTAWIMEETRQRLCLPSFLPTLILTRGRSRSRSGRSNGKPYGDPIGQALDGMKIVKPGHAAALPALFIG